MGVINKTLKFIVPFMAVGLVITGCANVGPVGTGVEVGSVSESDVEKETSKLNEKMDEEFSLEDGEEVDESEETEDSIYSDHTNMKFGKFTLNGISENNNMVTLVVEEKAFVTPGDKKLIEKYGLPSDLNGYDYEIVSIGEPELICAFKTDCPCIMFDYEKMEAKKVDWDTFGDHMLDLEFSHYDEESGETILEDGSMREIWAYYTVDDEGFMTNIEEVYIP